MVTCSAYAPKSPPLEVAIRDHQTCERRLIQAEAAKKERDLRNLKSLHFEKLQGARVGRRSIRISDQYRIEFTISEGERPPVVTVLAIGDTN